MLPNLLLVALLQSPPGRANLTQVVKPKVVSTASFAARNPHAMATITSGIAGGRLPAAASSGVPKHVQVSLTGKIDQGGAFPVKITAKFKPTETEGLRDFGQLTQGSGSSTAKEVTVWADGVAKASLKPLAAGKSSPFKLSFMEVRFEDTDGFTKPRFGGPGPWAKTVKTGDTVLVSVELSTAKLPAGVYDDELTLDTPDKTYRVPLRVWVVSTLVNLKVEKVQTPVLNMVTGDQQAAAFTLWNAGNTVFFYEIVGSGGPPGLSFSTPSGALAAGEKSPVTVLVKAPSSLAQPFGGGLVFKVQNKQTHEPVAQIVVDCTVDTLWKTWAYQLKTLDGKVVQTATLAASSGGLWTWDFELKDGSSITPDGNEAGFCWPSSAWAKSKGYYFKAYTSPGQRSQIHFGGHDPALEKAWPFIGAASVHLNSWDTVTSDPFFKLAAAAAAGWVSSPLAFLEYASNPIKDPTKHFSEWVAQQRVEWLKLGSAAIKP